MKQPIELRKQRDFGLIINDSFGFLKENFKPLIKSLFIICGFFLLISTVTTTFTYMHMADVFTITPGSADKYTESYMISAMFNAIMVILAQTCIYLVTLCYISVYLQKNNVQPTFAEVWAYFKFYFFRVVGSGILILLMTMLGFLLCIIPGMYVAPIFYLIIPIIVIENSSFKYAFDKSFRIIKENWWVTFGVIFIMSLIVGIAASCASIPLTLITLIGKFLSLKSFTLPLTIIFSALQSVLMLGYCLPAIAISLCYFDLSEKKDGTGLLSRIENFGKNDDDSSALPTEEY